MMLFNKQEPEKSEPSMTTIRLSIEQKKKFDRFVYEVKKKEKVGTHGELIMDMIDYITQAENLSLVN